MTSDGGMLIVREIARLRAAMRDSSCELLQNEETNNDLFAELECKLNSLRDYRFIGAKTLLTPFLKVIEHHEEAQDKAISVAMKAVINFLQYGVIDASNPNIGSTMKSIIDAVTNTRFLKNDQLWDCVTLCRVIDIIPTLVKSKTGKALPVESLDDIMNSYLKICFTSYLNESLRQAAEKELANMVGLMFNGSSEFPKSHSSLCFRKIIHLCNPDDNESTDLKVEIALSLLIVAVEKGAEFIGTQDAMMELIRNDLCSYLIVLMDSENFEIFDSALQVGFFLLKSLRSHLRSLLECYLMKLSEFVDVNTKYIKLQITLEHIDELWQIPGFIVERYTNYDTGIFTYFINLLSTLILSDSNNIERTQAISNDILVSATGVIAKHCGSANNGQKSKHPSNNNVGRTMFRIIWQSLMPAFSFIFDNSSGNVYHRVLAGIKRCAYIAAHYNIQDICQAIVLKLCDFTNLMSSNGPADITPAAVNFGLSPKAQAALITLFAVLHEHGERLGASRGKIINIISQLIRFKLLPTLETECLDQIVAYTSSVRHELDFLEKFIDFLSTSKHLQSVITELSLNSFDAGTLSFDRLSQQILSLQAATYGTELYALQEATACLNVSGDMNFMEKLKEIINDYIKPVEIKEITIDTRKVLQVIGKNVLISTILQAVEEKLANLESGIEEVHFIVTEILHVDADFQNQFWHGKNIVVMTRKLKIHNNVTWNTSGQNSCVVHSGDAGIAPNGHGKQGEDGTAGESGGNILILTDEIESAENLTITSSGGDGSNGQDGGPGKDGADGKSLTKQNLIDDFPSVIRFACWPTHRGELLDKTLKGIKSNSTVHENWNYLQHVFIRATTDEGHEITFSFCMNIPFYCIFQAFLFCSGSTGQEGCPGGANGLGGAGGYAGDVIVKNLKTDKTIEIVTSRTNGKDGDPGKGGKYGNRGKNGNDMGYVDYQAWKEAIYCDSGRKYKLEYYDKGDEPEDSVWCPRKNQYAAIKPAKVENKKVIDNRRNVRVNADRKHHAQAERKKNISKNSILNRYSQRDASASLEQASLQEMRSDLLNMEEQATQAKTENRQEQQTHTTQRRTQRGFSYRNVRKRSMYSTAETLSTAQTSNQSNCASQKVDLLKRNPLSLEAWINLRNVELSSLQLEEIFPLVGASELKHHRNVLDKILLGKYRYVTLHAIAKHLQPYMEVPEDPELVVRYLIPKRDDFLEIHHPTLGPLGEYLFEKVENSKGQRKKITNFCNKHFKNEDNETLKHSVRAYILEVGSTHKAYKKYYDRYRNLLDRQTGGCIIFAESFDYLDNSFCKDNKLVEAHLKHIEKKGTCSESYIVLLAHIFDANIRLYTEADDNKLSLQNCHNPTAGQYMHALCKGTRLIPLQIEKNCFELEEDRKLKDALYKKILKETDAFDQKQKFDDYLHSGTFDNLHGCGNSDSEILQSVHYPSEQKDIEEIVKYFPNEEDQQILKMRLEAIKFRFVGQQGVLHNIAERFSTEGRHLSLQELCYLISSIMTSRVNNVTEKNTFSWVVSAYPQRNWIDELMLLQLENHVKGTLTEKSEWRSFLSNIANKDVLLLFIVKLEQQKSGDPLSVERIKTILYLLSSIPNETIDLGDLGLSEWPYLLKEKYWSHKLSDLANWTPDNLLIASYYILSMENIYGTDIVKRFLSILSEKTTKPSPETLTNILVNFCSEKWNLGTVELENLTSCTVVNWTEQLNEKFNANNAERDIVKLIDIIKGNANTSTVISENLATIKNTIDDISKKNRKFSENDTENSIKSDCLIKFPTKVDKRKQDIETQTELLALIDRAVKMKKGFWLRDTQKLSIMALLTNNGSTLAQVSTGEGKSLIVVAISIIRAFFGEKVHIITSSTVLAKRDAEEHSDLYHMFNIKVSHNCSEDIEKRKDAYSNHEVIYGDLSNFQRDYLLDRFYGKNILGDHKFRNVIVDEVDSMLLDNGNNMLYLSHDMADFNKLESLYVYIWQCINQPTDNYEDAARVFDRNIIKRAVLYDLYGVITSEDIQKLGSELTKDQQKTIFKRLIGAGILDDEGRLLKQTVENADLEEMLAPEFTLYQDRLSYQLNRCINRTKCVNIPNYLRPFVEEHLESWINSAMTAFFMKTGHDYVVDVDRTGTSSDRNPNITIIDKDTGTDLANSQWDEALHQFLQLKHGCKLTLQTLKAVFVSNVSFFKLYSHLFGLTGTLGSQVERDLLRQIHKVEFVTIPTAKSKKFYEDDTIVCVDSNEWIKNIQMQAQRITEEKRRSVLIICETVNEVETLHRSFSGTNAAHLHTYRRDYEEFDIAKGSKELEQGHIIIATNLAGRGTDIKLTTQLRNAGGLHVLLTYLPNNKRIEQQAFGRAARSGDPGSGQLIILIESDVRNYTTAQILNLKWLRDNDELYRISDIKKYYETQIITEEKCFEAFSDQYKRVKSELEREKTPTEIQEILLQSCLDKWAFWIDINSKRIKHLTSKHERESLNGQLDHFIDELREFKVSDYLSWIEKYPVYMVKLGKYYAKNKKHNEAIRLFDRVIQQEPDFSEAAHYYKAFALSKKIDWSQKPFRANDDNKVDLKMLKQELRIAARLLDERSQFSAYAAAIIGKIMKNNKQSMVQIDAYEEQHKCLGSLYSVFAHNIDGILGRPVSAQAFIKFGISEETANILFKELLEKGILRNLRVKKHIATMDLKSISCNYKIPLETLTGFLSPYQGKQIDQQQFGKALKQQIPLPSRGAFWKFLLEKEILINQIKYVILSKQKLETFDPTLFESLQKKIEENAIERQPLECGYRQIFLRAEQLSQHNPDDYVFKKADFLALITKDKYQLLKKKGVIILNRKADTDLSKITASTVFPSFDSIVVNDFVSLLNMTEKEADQVVAHLISGNVIAADQSESSNIYRLKMEFDSFDEIEFPLFPIYEYDVKRLLSVCFAYRITLQKLVKNLDEDADLICLPLMTKPHQMLLMELLTDAIVKPVSVNKFTKDQLAEILERLGITKEDEYQKKCVDYVKELINTKPLAENEYVKAALPTLGIANISIEEFTEKHFKKIGQSLGLFGEDPILTSIYTMLTQSISLIKTLKCPDSTLEALAEHVRQYESIDPAEVHIFFLSAFDHLIQLKEEQWSQEMLINTAIVFVMGAVQIAIGVAIEFYSIGAMSHVGKAFISEGISDLFFATSALSTGYFDWSDYRQHKVESIMYTALTVGTAPYFSGSQTFQYKLGVQNAGPATAKSVGKDILQRTFIQTLKAISFGFANAGVDILIQNHLQNLARGIGSQILLNIDRDVEKHSISKTLEDAYRTLGKEEAAKLVKKETKSVLTKKCCTEKYLPIAIQIANSVTQGIAEATRKSNKTGSRTIQFAAHEFIEAIVWGNRVQNLLEIDSKTDSLLDMLDIKLKQKLSKKTNQSDSDRRSTNDEDCKDFTKETIYELKQLLKAEVGTIVLQNIISPIMKQGANYLVEYVGKSAHRVYQYYKQSANHDYDHFDNVKKEYKENQQKEEDAQQKQQQQEERKPNFKALKHFAKKWVKDLKQMWTDKNYLECIIHVVRGSCTLFDTLIEYKNSKIETDKKEETQKKESNAQKTFQQYTSKRKMEILSSEIMVLDYGSRIQRLILNSYLHGPQSRRATAEMEQAEECKETEGCEETQIQTYLEATISNTVVAQGTGGDRDPNEMENVPDSEPDEGIVQIAANEVYQSILESEILLSQDSISDHTRAGLYIGEIAANMLESGYNGDPIRAVLIEDKLVVLDHRRLLAAAVTRSDQVLVSFKIYLPDDILDSPVCGTTNAREAVRLRMRGGNLRNFDSVGFPSSKVRIRTGDGNSHPTRESTESTLRSLNFTIGPRPRSNSIAREDPGSRNSPKPKPNRRWSSTSDLRTSDQDRSNNNN